MPTPDIQSLVLEQDKLGTYTCLTLDDAPVGPGLYAWYAQMRAGRKDWEMALENGLDDGERACRTLLQRHTTRFARQGLSVAAHGAFSSRWSGELSDNTIDEIALALGPTPLEADDDSPRPQALTTPKLEDTLTSPKKREALLRALQLATPILAAPLYIGVATDLRSRLNQHKDELFKLDSQAAKDPKFREGLVARRAKLPNFASRATAAGFGPDSLVVYTLSLELVVETGDDEANLRHIAEAAEWLLNRWHQPPFGKR